MRCLALMLVLLLAGCTVEDQGRIDAHFCPQYDCEGLIFQLLDESKTAQCALYDASDEVASRILLSGKAELIMDYENSKNLRKRFPQIIPAKRDHEMHDKFCIFDGKIVLTGSYNPTGSSSINNIVVIGSLHVAMAYEDEFLEMKHGTFSGGKKVAFPRILVNGSLVEARFCPEDCSERTYTRIIDRANSSVHFMTYSFTDDEIAEALLRASDRGVKVTGILEKSQLSKYSEYQRLYDAGLNLSIDDSPGLMHNKVFIIDSMVVITGSTNPTKNGLTRNDENTLIIYDKRIARLFIDEYQNLNK